MKIATSCDIVSSLEFRGLGTIIELSIQLNSAPLNESKTLKWNYRKTLVVWLPLVNV